MNCRIQRRGIRTEHNIKKQDTQKVMNEMQSKTTQGKNELECTTRGLWPWWFLGDGEGYIGITVSV